MKYTWEPKDIKPGMRTKPAHAKEVWMVGYDPAINGEAGYFQVSTLDGMMSARALTVEGMADHLNEANHEPVPPHVQTTP